MNSKSKLKKLAKKNFYDLYQISLDKLLTQQSDWFMKRLEYLLEGNWDKAEVIEIKYLEPLEKKINRLTSIAKEEVNEK